MYRPFLIVVLVFFAHACKPRNSSDILSQDSSRCDMSLFQVYPNRYLQIESVVFSSINALFSVALGTEQERPEEMTLSGVVPGRHISVSMEIAADSFKLKSLDAPAISDPSEVVQALEFKVGFSDSDRKTFNVQAQVHCPNDLPLVKRVRLGPGPSGAKDFSKTMGVLFSNLNDDRVIFTNPDGVDHFGETQSAPDGLRIAGLAPTSYQVEAAIADEFNIKWDFDSGALVEVYAHRNPEQLSSQNPDFGSFSGRLNCVSEKPADTQNVYCSCKGVHLRSNRTSRDNSHELRWQSLDGRKKGACDSDPMFDLENSDRFIVDNGLVREAPEGRGYGFRYSHNRSSQLTLYRYYPNASSRFVYGFTNNGSEPEIFEWPGASNDDWSLDVAVRRERIVTPPPQGLRDFSEGFWSLIRSSLGADY